MDKDFWIEKGSGHLSNGDTAYTEPSKIPPKRSQQWFVGPEEPELFPNKKQAVQASNTRPDPGILKPHAPQWSNISSYPALPEQFISQLFGPVPERYKIDTLQAETKGIGEQFGNDINVGLSISHAAENSGVGYSGSKKVKVNQVKDSENVLHPQNEHGYNRGMSTNNISLAQAYGRDGESNHVSIEQGYNGAENVALMGHVYDRGDEHVRLLGPVYENNEDGNNFNNRDDTTISFDCFQDGTDVQFTRPTSSYDLFYNQSSAETIEPSEIGREKELDAVPNVNALVTGVPPPPPPPQPKSKPKAIVKNISESKAAKKEVQNSFPTNVRSFIATGILDGVPVKYVALSREELRGIIKGAGYLCGCQTCNFSKALNAFEFERHAGCKTKHPNNHIYFENGRTIYQIVQELKTTPECFLFDAIQNGTGSQINQKNFRIWKESFQAASRELQRIYGKELNT